MITVHHLDHSRSQRILWLLEELDQPYELVAHQRDPKTLRAPQALRDIHPLGKAPVVVIGEEVLAESGAIVETLLERFDAGRLAPAPGTPEAVRYRYWLHYAEGSLMPLLMIKLVLGRMAQAPLPPPALAVAAPLIAQTQAQMLDPQLALHLSVLQDELAQRPWFAGDAFSAADIQMHFAVQAAQARAGQAAQTPPLRDWLARCAARPAFQRAVARGGDASALPA